MLKRFLTTLSLTSLLFYSCENTTPVSTGGTTDTLYINDGGKILWGLETEFNDSSKEDVSFFLVGTSDFDEIPYAEINGIKPYIDSDIDDLIEEGFELDFDDKFKVGDIATVKTIYKNDTLEASITVPPRVTSLTCNGISVADTAKGSDGNNVVISKEVQTLTFTWENPDNTFKTHVSGYIDYIDTNGGYKYDSFYGTVLSVNSFTYSLPADFKSFNDSRLSFYLCERDAIKMGGTPHFKSAKQNMYTEIFGPRWSVYFSMEE